MEEPAAGKARLPAVESLTDGTTRRSVASIVIVSQMYVKSMQRIRVHNP